MRSILYPTKDTHTPPYNITTGAKVMIRPPPRRYSSTNFHPKVRRIPSIRTGSLIPTPLVLPLIDGFGVTPYMTFLQ